jgi:uncharacterized SAM-binding protein YcdF (DUF218 family)
MTNSSISANTLDKLSASTRQEIESAKKLKAQIAAKRIIFSENLFNMPKHWRV